MENDSASPVTMSPFTAELPAELPAANAIVALHDRLLATPGWPADAPAASGDLWHWVQTNHRNNSLLWAEEDLARRTTVAAEAIAEVTSTGGAVSLDPMNPFERKVVHDAVAAAGLVSDSEGVEPNRHVVIRSAS